MIYVSHRLDDIFRIADRVAVLRDGRLVNQKKVADTRADDLVEMIVGRPIDRNPRRNGGFAVGAFLGSTTIKPGRVNVWAR
ncbi:ABC-type sugar transport system ATPase subunit [Mesorhizobium robiniae]|uniref:ABC-type sugar transport system ATPase subunit n=1 Tax=Mesorhizobium robiniae TaxID=559315 RepID=A0ABV2GZ92_9HYPH